MSYPSERLVAGREVPTRLPISSGRKLKRKKSLLRLPNSVSPARAGIGWEHRGVGFVE
ncbi:MAG: hypothetical protein GY938_27285 [Ketobacter sp.]|nr:hypothetical protein [Ketobacter sp.]